MRVLSKANANATGRDRTSADSARSGRQRSVDRDNTARRSIPDPSSLARVRKVAGTGVWLDLADPCAAAFSSPGGKEENTGSASKLSDRLTMGSVEVISSDPVKLLRPNRSTIFCASCPLGNRVSSTLASTGPAASLAVKVTRAAVAEGLA